MPHLIRSPAPPLSILSGRASVHMVPTGQDNLSWILQCSETGQAAVIDGPEAAPVMAYATAHGLQLRTLWNTHVHGDHVGINRDLQRDGLLADWQVVGAAATASAVPGLTQPVRDGDSLQLGALRARVLRTDGHIDGHLCFVVGEGEDAAVFTGDTLFSGGCGYLFDGPPEAMFRSLMRLAALPGDPWVFCAHAYTQDNLRFAWSIEPDNQALATRIQRVWATRALGQAAVPSRLEVERATNPFLRPGSPTLCRSLAAAWPGRLLDTPAQVFAATRALKDRGLHKALTDHDLPLSQP